MHLTLLVPELIWPEPGDQLTLGKLATPGFEWLEGRSAFVRSTALPVEKCAGQLFGMPEVALAELRLAGEEMQPATGGAWLCADPVHLRFHHERIVLADAGAFEIDTDEAAALVAALNAEFADIGVFHAATPRRWYLRLHAAVDHPAAPLSAVAGRRMDSELTDKTSPLYRWLNEVQMFLHGHPVNTARAAQGKPAVNSLWLWGNGQASTTLPNRFDTVWSNDPLLLGAGKLAGARCHTRPDSLASVLREGGGNSLVHIDTLLPTVLYENTEAWRQGFAALESGFFAPLAGRPGKAIHQLDIVAPTIYGQLRWTLPKGERWKFWKKGRSPAALATTLAEGQPQGQPS